MGLAGVGSYFAFYKPTTLYIATSASLGTTSISSTQTTMSETISTTVVPTQWLTVGQVKSINYYINLLETNGTDPYARLGEELRRLPDLTPDLTNATAVAQITYLALNATNPEVKEAFTLMMNGGTPDPSDFQYQVPQYNTELQVLYWLAEQSKFKKDDTLALAIALDNGLWVTMGTSEVVTAVRNDTTNLLVFLRETNSLQETRGYFRLEDLPLEAKIQLAWTGGESMRHGYGPPIGLIYWTEQKLPIKIYDADAVSVSTLTEMRSEADMNGWMQPGADVGTLVSNVEDYLFFPTGPHFNYRTDYSNIVNGQGIMAVEDVNWQWAQHEKGSRFQGDCGTEMDIAGAWLKSWGIATVSEWTYTLFTQNNMKKFSHSFIIYYEPLSKTWKAYWKQLSDQVSYWTLQDGGTMDQPFNMFICRPPVIQQGYLREDSFNSRTINGTYYAGYWHFEGNMYYQIEVTPWIKLDQMLSNGIPTGTMKQWLLYWKPVA